MQNHITPREAALRAFSPSIAPSVTLNQRGGPSRGLVASARKLTEKDARTGGLAASSAGKTASWQDEAWELQDQIGEQRFLAHTLAGRMAQARFYVSKRDPEAAVTDDPTRAEEPGVQDVLYAIGGGPNGLAQLVNRLGLNLFIAGEGWLVGIPPELVEGTPEHAEVARRAAFGVTPLDREGDLDTSDNALRLIWRMLSVSEVATDTSGNATLRMEDGTSIEAPVSRLFMLRIWRPHPRRAWEADSPTRSSLPVLRELYGLTMHVSAQIDSRLAGAGLLVISTSADATLKRQAGLPENDPSSPLMDALEVVMATPIEHRDRASALVPITLAVPDEVVDKVKHISFAAPLDKEAPKLRDEAIRRLALGQDAPPELLLGTGGMNHWGAWLVREDVVQTHLEPPLTLIADALTTQYLRPVLIGMGYTSEQAELYSVSFDVSHMIERPTRGADAKDLYDRSEISGSALREELGFDDSHAPEELAKVDPAVTATLDMAARAPSLAANPGLDKLYEMIKHLYDGTTPETPGDADPAAADVVTPAAPTIPATQGAPASADTPGGGA